MTVIVRWAFDIPQENGIPTEDSGAEKKPGANELVAKCRHDFDQVLTDAASRPWLQEIWGKWPGDESIEELLAALKESR
jgi:hypothetical protein